MQSTTLGLRVRELPIRLEKLLSWEARNADFQKQQPLREHWRCRFREKDADRHRCPGSQH
jgi:hypothetical protein